ncbi:GntP family permease [Corynebacterium glyciniphilum]|uniref:GntP family permease n=1 Tax=Corynebacterium glyciniphilum TaxID=1404244 RepID=UPI001643061E|nr:gluconate:H+ symporter [Corynebacterium glyciniphilum]
MDSVPWITTSAIVAVVALLLLIIKFKLQPFLALLIAAIGFGLATGMNPPDLAEFIVDRMGSSLGQIALVIGLGSMFGEILGKAGVAEKLANVILNKVPERGISWGLGLAGFLISIAVFIDVAIVILVPMLYPIARRTGKSLLRFAIPLCAGLSVTHTFIPPTPGPIATAGIMDADLGLVILYGVICGLPAMAVAGPIWGKYISSKIYVPAPEPEGADGGRKRGGSFAGSDERTDAQHEISDAETDLPSFKSVIVMLLVPLVLILVGTTGDLVLDEGSVLQSISGFVGHPVIALLITTLLSLWKFGIRRGKTMEELQKITTAALAPAGTIILITGAGGVFGGVLVETGFGEIIAEGMAELGFPIILFGFLTSLVIRVSQGSGTVAMITGATLTAPIAASMDLSPSMVALCCVAIACGGTAASHVNDTGFWMANRYIGMSVADTLKSWTVMKTLVGCTGFVCALLLSLFVS